ncbi:hypothetical protein FA13DRAFT_1802150 [Coprinellus micaceus]|uniref:Nephrocystin 3-like N-terminal domain-containing protein n=1 Tax=Coprinellus micaceus TaxID=71717 RepID=A0A4Y7SD71_COPMI|nr:hypothetical protein FA13DRAFT_1802150 [Coprinellus micaceus]
MNSQGQTASLPGFASDVDAPPATPWLPGSRPPIPPTHTAARCNPPPIVTGHSYPKRAPLSNPTSAVAGTSYFPYSHHVNIGNLTTSSGPTKRLFDYLNLHITHGAAHNSDERSNAPACHEETRITIREDIVSWIKQGEGDKEPKKIMWLSGPAGCGKTAIAGSVAETCKEECLLAASFFFSSFLGSAERRLKRGLIATLAYQMSKHEVLHRFKSCLHAAVDRHPDIFSKNLKEQVKCLILDPFKEVQFEWENWVHWPKIVIIDGLDEVVAAQNHYAVEWQSSGTSEVDQVEILSTLTAMAYHPAFPFRIFVASRPESNISNFFATKARAPPCVSSLTPNTSLMQMDIQLIVARAIRPRPLVEMSLGQFIVPTTIIQWVKAGVPQVQLDEVLKLAASNTGTKNPFATLDALYRHILQRAHSTDNDPHLVVKWIMCITSAMGLGRRFPPANFWRKFLENVEGELSYRLGPISSLIFVPSPDDTSSLITIYHKSFTDFLSSLTRCGDLYVGDAVHTSFVSERILVVLKSQSFFALILFRNFIAH